MPALRVNPERPQRVLVVIPNWVGDVVLATPALAALRRGLADARISFLMRRYVAEVLDGGGWSDDAVYWPAERGLRREWAGWRLARALRAEGYDLAVLLTNSFRAAWTAWCARIPQRIGFDRDARGWMLTHRLLPLREEGRFVPTSVLGSYCQLADAAGGHVTDRKLRLGVTASQEAAAEALRRHYGLEPGAAYAVINPGAAFGAAKCWPAECFSALCDRLRDALGLRAVIVGAPGEAPLMRRIAENCRTAAICCDAPGTTLGSLKPLIRDASLLVCNDTGPRHYGNAFDTPTVTIFGPTHQAWTETGYDREVCLQRKVPCGPCQLRVCPIDHRCMTEMTVDMVFAAAEHLLRRSAGPGRPASVMLAREGA